MANTFSFEDASKPDNYTPTTSTAPANEPAKPFSFDEAQGKPEP